MALNLETLSVALRLDGGNFKTGMNQALAQTESFRDRLASTGKAVTSFGQRVTGFVTLPIVAAGTAFVKWAASAENAIGKTNQVFGDNAAAVIAWSETTDKAMGIAQSDALQMTSTYGALFNMMDVGTETSALMSQEMLQLSADVAAFNDVSQDRASEAIMAGLTGEYESLKRMGVFLNENIVNQEAMNIALADGRSEITEADKVLARYNLILEQTTQQQGQFARESGSFNGRLAVLTARFKNLGAMIGAKLIPPLVTLMGWLMKVFDTIEGISPKALTFAIVLVAIAAAIGPLLIVLGGLLSGLSVLLGVVAFLISPIGLVIAAVALLAYIFRDELGAALDWIVEKFNEVRVAFDVFRQMTDPVSAALKALALVFPQIADVIEPLLDMVDNLKTAFQQVKDGNFGAAFDSIAGAARNLWDAIKAAFALIDWGAILSALGSLTIALASWLYAQASAVDWGGVIGTAASAVGDITGTIVGKLGNLTVALFLWVWNAASAVPWGELISAAAATAGDVAAAIVGKIGDLAASLKTWYDNAIDSVNWGGMGESIGSKIGDLTMALAPKAAELLQGFLTAVVNPGLWAGIGMALLTMMLALPVAIGYVGMTMAPKALEFLQGFVTGLDINWYLVAMWMTLLGTKALTAVGSLVDTLTQKGIELITGLLTGAQNTWTGTVMPYLSTRKEQAASLVGDLLSTLTQKGTDLITGLLTGAKNFWLGSVQPYLHQRGAQAFASIGSVITSLTQKGTDLITGMLTGAKNYWLGSVQPYLHERGAQAFASIGSLVTTLLSKGKDLINGLYAGAMSKWNEARDWLSGIPGRAANAVGSLGGILVGAGASLIQGLIDGINSKIDDLQSILSTITGLIPDWKGPPERDRKLLFGNGVLIMQGLGRGLDRGWNDVTRQLSDYTSAISGDFGGNVDASRMLGGYVSNEQSTSPSAAPVTNYYVVTLPTEEWVDVATAARTAPERTANLMRKARSLVPQGGA